MIERDKVVRLINSVVAKVGEVEELSREQIHHELLGLKDIIDKAHADLRALNVGDISSKHIPSATDELDEVTKATETATMGIFSSCEAIEKVLPGLADHHRGEIQNQITKIYESCSFQDITGQRIRKVIKGFRDIESKVQQILGVYHEKVGDLNLHQITPDTRKGDEALLNGPQMPAAAISQADIDKLLADFDTK